MKRLAKLTYELEKIDNPTKEQLDDGKLTYTHDFNWRVYSYEFVIPNNILKIVECDMMTVYCNLSGIKTGDENTNIVIDFYHI